MKCIQNLGVLAVALACACGAAPVHAEGYPTKPIRLIVPFEAGGTTDVLVRTVAPLVASDLGQPVVIDNKGGAGGVIGATLAVRSAPDGYTFVVGSAALATNTGVEAGLPYDPGRDLEAVAGLATTPYFVIANTRFPAGNVGDLVKLGRQSPGTLTYASSGVGTSPHVAGARFAAATGTSLLHVPYKGTGPALNDLLAGNVDLMFVGLPSAGPHVKAGRLKILAVAAASRVALAPDVPTVAEAGGPAFSVNSWFGILAPRGTPLAVRERVAQAVRRALANPEVVTRYAALGALPMKESVRQFDAFYRDELQTASRFAKEHPELLR